MTEPPDEDAPDVSFTGLGDFYLYEFGWSNESAVRFTLVSPDLRRLLHVSVHWVIACEVELGIAAPYRGWPLLWEARLDMRGTERTLLLDCAHEGFVKVKASGDVLVEVAPIDPSALR